MTIMHSKAPESVVPWERCAALHALAAPLMFCALWGERAYLCVDDPEEDAG